MQTNCFVIFFNLGYFLHISIRSSGLGQSIIGQKQDVICSIAIPQHTIELGWLNEDDIITNDSRVTINTSSSDRNLVTTIQFDPLTIEDDGEYICYAVINGLFLSNSICLQNITGKLCIKIILCM